MSFIGLGNPTGKMPKMERLKMIKKWLDGMNEKNLVKVQHDIEFFIFNTPPNMVGKGFNK